MKSTKLHILTTYLISLILIFPGIASATLNVPLAYAGINCGIKHSSFVTEYGGNVFKSKQPMANVFIGIEIVPNLNLQISAESTTNSKRQATLFQNNVYLGIPIMDNQRTFQTSMKIFGIGSDLIYKFNPLCCKHFNLLFGIGAKITKINLTTKNVSVVNGSVAKLNIHNTKVIMKLLAGYEYMFTKNYGVSGIINWENTSSLKPTGFLKSGGIINAKLKNTLSYTLGVLYKF